MVAGDRHDRQRPGGDRDKALASGMDDHVPKPVNVEDLFATLARWVHLQAPSPLLHPLSAPTLWPSLPDIDVDIGRAVTGGNDKRIATCSAGSPTSSTIYGAVSRRVLKRRYEAAMRMLHDLKGVAGTLGAGGVRRYGSSARRFVGRRCRCPIVDERIESVARALGAVIAQLAALNTESGL